MFLNIFLCDDLILCNDKIRPTEITPCSSSVPSVWQNGQEGAIFKGDDLLYSDGYRFLVMNSFLSLAPAMSLDMLRRLFPSPDNGCQIIPILIGMVDNDRSRQLFDEYFYSEEVKDLVWIDLGIEGMTQFESPNEEEKKIMNESGFGGQCCVGLNWRGEVCLPPVTRVYSNILENDHTAFPGQSCGELLPENPQRIVTNQFAAQVATMVMNNLFHTKSIYASVVNFNVQLGQMKPTFLTSEQIKDFERARKRVWGEIRNDACNIREHYGTWGEPRSSHWFTTEEEVQTFLDNLHYKTRC